MKWLGKEKIANAILVGDINKTKEIAKDINLDLSNYELIHIEDLSEASLKSVELVSQWKSRYGNEGFSRYINNIKISFR